MAETEPRIWLGVISWIAAAPTPNGTPHRKMTTLYSANARPPLGIKGAATPKGRINRAPRLATLTFGERPEPDFRALARKPPPATPREPKISRMRPNSSATCIGVIAKSRISRVGIQALTPLVNMAKIDTPKVIRAKAPKWART